MKLHNQPQRGALVKPCMMSDGAIGVIRAWDGDKYLGELVQRHGDALICLGCGEGDSWDDILVLDGETEQIEILPKGTLLEI